MATKKVGQNPPPLFFVLVGFGFGIRDSRWKKIRILDNLPRSAPLICIFVCTGGAYYVPYSFLLISNKFCNGGGGGGSGPSRAIKFLSA
jgi:hypothetical protein